MHARSVLEADEEMGFGDPCLHSQDITGASMMQSPEG